MASCRIMPITVNRMVTTNDEGRHALQAGSIRAYLTFT